MAVKTRSGLGTLNPRRVFYGWWIVGAGFLLMLFSTGVGFYGFSAFVGPIANSVAGGSRRGISASQSRFSERSQEFLARSSDSWWIGSARAWCFLSDSRLAGPDSSLSLWRRNFGSSTPLTFSWLSGLAPGHFWL